MATFDKQRFLQKPEKWLEKLKSKYFFLAFWGGWRDEKLIASNAEISVPSDRVVVNMPK